MAFRMVVIVAVLIGPLVALVVSNGTSVSFQALLNERSRLGTLILTTVSLAILAALIAVPLGTVLGLLLERLPLRGRWRLQFLITLALFVPLPVTAIAWQIVLGTWLPPLSLAPGEIAWRPWNQGLLPAVFVHAMAALPWVAIITHAGLRHADRGLEEEALVSGGPRVVLRFVLWPKLMLTMMAAIAWVSVQTFTEIPVTDAMMVRTFAEEVYTQIVGVPLGIAAAMALTLPVLLAVILTTCTIVARVIRQWPTSPEALTPSRLLPMNAGKRFTLLAWGIVTLAVIVPLLALFWKAGGGGATEGGSIPFAFQQLKRVLTLHGPVLAMTLVTAMIAGVVTTAQATSLCWWARNRRSRRFFVMAIAVILALTPGPLTGFGLKSLIFALIDLEAGVLKFFNIALDFPPLLSALYDQPSPLPYLWSCVLRYFAVAVVIVAPVVRSLPQNLVELARQDGVNAWRYVGRPLVLRASAWAAVAVAGLSLGEVSAGKLVLPPGCRIYVLELFDQMHYGAESTVAAMALVQVLLAVPVAIALSMKSPLRPRGI